MELARDRGESGAKVPPFARCACHVCARRLRAEGAARLLAHVRTPRRARRLGAAGDQRAGAWPSPIDSIAHSLRLNAAAQWAQVVAWIGRNVAIPQPPPRCYPPNNTGVSPLSALLGIPAPRPPCDFLLKQGAPLTCPETSAFRCLRPHGPQLASIHRGRPSPSPVTCARATAGHVTFCRYSHAQPARRVFTPLCAARDWCTDRLDLQRCAAAADRSLGRGTHATHQRLADEANALGPGRD